VRRAALLVVAGLPLLAAGGVAVWLARRPSLPPPPTPAELEGLKARREELQRQLDEALARDDQGLGQAPKAGILIGVPTVLTRDVVQQVVGGLFAETTLTLRNLKAKVSKDVRAKMVFRKRTIGHIDLQVDIHEVQGLLKPGKPRLAFGQNRIAVTLPVRVAEGHGRATLHAFWDSRGIANAVCGDVEVHPEVTGTVVPADYELSGAFRFRTEGEQIVLEPDFPELAVRIYVKATEESWKVVERVVEERNAACRFALDKVDLRQRLETLLGKGFNVKIPRKILKPVRLPAGIQKSLEMQGVRLTLQLAPTALVITPDRLWYGADVRARAGPKPAAAPPPPPPPAPDVLPTGTGGSPRRASPP
jgi:hypothetical protein